jgi:hypothetical protein
MLWSTGASMVSVPSLSGSLSALLWILDASLSAAVVPLPALLFLFLLFLAMSQQIVDK